MSNRFKRSWYRLVWKLYHGPKLKRQIKHMEPKVPTTPRVYLDCKTNRIMLRHPDGHTVDLERPWDYP